MRRTQFQLKAGLACFGLLFAWGLFASAPVFSADTPYCLCQWKSSLSSEPSITDDTKYTCIGTPDGVLDKEGSEFGFLTAEDLKTIKISSCSAIPPYIIDIKGIVSVKDLSCAQFTSKPLCVDARIKAIESNNNVKKACFCSSSDGQTKAKCVPDDGQECKSLVGSEYTSCVLQDANSCLTSVGAAVEKEVKSVDQVQAKKTIEQSARTEFNRLGTTDLKTLLGRVIQTAMGIMGSLALAMFVYGGFLWMTSAGNSDKTQKAVHIVVWSSLGLIVILSSYTLVKLVFETII